MRRTRRQPGLEARPPSLPHDGSSHSSAAPPRRIGDTEGWPGHILLPCCSYSSWATEEPSAWWINIAQGGDLTGPVTAVATGTKNEGQSFGLAIPPGTNPWR